MTTTRNPNGTLAATRHPERKRCPVGGPFHEVWRSLDGRWTWYVRKFYQSREATTANPYGRVECVVTSPHTEGDGDFGDVYYREITGQAVRIGGTLA